MYGIYIRNSGGNMKVYLVIEGGGQWEDSWDCIVATFLDSATAEQACIDWHQTKLANIETSIALEKEVSSKIEAFEEAGREAPDELYQAYNISKDWRWDDYVGTRIVVLNTDDVIGSKKVCI